MNTQDYLMGKMYYAYKFFGANKKGNGSYIFRYFGSECDEVYLLGDFNLWQATRMRKYKSGVFSLTVENVSINDNYQYLVVKDGIEYKKIDPFSYMIDTGRKTSQIVETNYKFKYKKVNFDPKNILEVYLGNIIDIDSEDIKESLDELIEYAKEGLYTSIKIKPLNEYQDKRSLGYKTYGLFSISKRYNNLREIKAFVDRCHGAQISVIAEIDISQFDDDPYYLVEDNDSIYTYDYEDIRYNYKGNINFDFTKPISKSMVKSALCFLADELKIDAIELANIENLIYWQADKSRGVNKDNIDFINELIRFSKDQKFILTANSYNKIDNYFNFDYYFDNSSRDLIRMIKSPPYKRDSYKRYIRDLLENKDESKIIGFSYIDSFIDEANLAMKAYGDFRKISQIKALLTLVYSINNPKLLYLGDDKGYKETFSALNKYKISNKDDEKELYLYYKDLAKIFLDNKNSYKKINVFDTEGYSLYAFEKIGKEGKLLVIINFTDIDYRVNAKLDLVEILNSEDLIYGGSGNINGAVNRDEPIYVSSYSAIIFKIKN